MDLIGLIDQVRDHYVEQFESFVDRQTEICTRGRAEVKFQIPKESGLHRQLVVADFVKTDDGVEAVAFVPEQLLQFDHLTGMFGEMRLTVEALRWDNAVLHYSPEVHLQLERWFEHWLDPDDRRHDPTAKLGLVIHSLYVEPGFLAVDFGTAPGEALVQLIQEMEAAGVNLVVINSDAGQRQ